MLEWATKWGRHVVLCHTRRAFDRVIGGLRYVDSGTALRRPAKSDRRQAPGVQLIMSGRVSESE